AAVTSVLPSSSAAGWAVPEERGAASVRLPEDEAAGPLRRALWPAAAGLAVVVTVVWLALVVPRGRRNGWRPTGT
ncbi:peptidase, partial [Streptomyces sp. TRM76130]|nr:peptidase [Streptomyces sp. TRM76130]